VVRGRGRGSSSGGVRRGVRRGRPSQAVFHDNPPIELPAPPDTILHERHMPEDYAHVPTSKKRALNRDSWKQFKRTRVPREYQSCDCRKQCGDKFTDGDIDALRTHFFGLRGYNDQQVVLLSCISSKPSIRGNGLMFRYSLKTSGGDVEVCCVFSVPTNGSGCILTISMIQVCSTQLRNVFSMSVDRLQKIRSENQKAYFDGRTMTSPTRDRRGRHNNRPRTVSDDIVAKVTEIVHPQSQSVTVF
jgi:hypothetical protein